MGQVLSCEVKKSRPQFFPDVPTTEKVGSKKSKKDDKTKKTRKRHLNKVPALAGAHLGCSVALAVFHPHSLPLSIISGVSACGTLYLVRSEGKPVFTAVSGATAFAAANVLLRSHVPAVDGILTAITCLGPVAALGGIAAPVLYEQFHNSVARDALLSERTQTISQQAKLLARILGWAAEDSWMWPAGYALLITSSILSTSLPVAFTGLVSAVATPGVNPLPAIAKLSGTVLLVSAVGSAQSILFGEAATRLSVRVQKKVMANVLKQDMDFFDATSSGDILTQMGSTGSVTGVVSSLIPTLLRSMVSTTTTFVILSRFNIKLALITVIAIPFEVCMSFWYSRFYEKYAEKAQQINSRSSTIVTEMVGSVKTVRMFSAEQAQLDKFWTSVDEMIKLRRANNWILAGSGLIDVVLPHVTSMIMFLYAGHLAMLKEINVAQLITISMYQMSLTSAFESIAGVYVGWGGVMGQTKKVMQYMDRDPKNNPRGTYIPENLEGRIEFRNVSFTYNSSNNAGEVLHDFNLSVKPGEVVALVGPSGGGKSTVINLLMGLYDPSDGSIEVDGVPVHRYDPVWYYKKAVSCVNQDPVLFSCSFTDNLQLGLEPGEVSRDQIEEAAKLANAHDFIVKMKDGYDTRVGSRGERLSGGQRQRVAIARALVRNPSILLLDEATSALDAESEACVQEAIERLMKGRTTIVVAHRLSTIQNADRILVISKGKIVQEGKHQELLAQSGVYRDLVKRQLSGKKGQTQESDAEEDNSVPTSPIIPLPETEKKPEKNDVEDTEKNINTSDDLGPQEEPKESPSSPPTKIPLPTVVEENNTTTTA